jgi:ubiquinone/menaquinone biosynthesis C-methylase UbiE
VSTLDARYFDQWYADMTGSSVLEAAKHRHLGLPPELMSSSGLTFDGLREIASMLAIGPGSTLLDLACGRGGYGLWLARETGARVVGVDFSAVALRQAAEAVVTFGLPPEQAEFRVGELEDIGLPDQAVDALICIDAVQFAGDIVTAARECRRVLRPGGVAVFTCWVPVDPADLAVPDRLRRLDPSRQLPQAGFLDVTVSPRPGWRAAERAFWEAAVAQDPGDDPALQSWHEEGQRVLPAWEAVRRVIATARAPQ